MPKYNTQNLTPYKSKWKNGKTKLIRVPEVLAEQILDLAHQLDDNINNVKNYESLVTEKLKIIIDKINNKEKGYKSNSASALIRDLKALQK